MGSCSGEVAGDLLTDPPRRPGDQHATSVNPHRATVPFDCAMTTSTSVARRRIRRVLGAFVLVLLVEYLVLPQIAGARKELHLLTKVNGFLLALGLVLEGASLVSYAMLTRSLLPAGQRPSVPTLVRIVLSTLAVSHVVPGGTAAGAGLGYRMLTDEGVRGSNAGFALATQSLGSAVVLNLLLWVGLVISIPLAGFDPLYGTAALVGILLLGGFAALVLLLTKGEARAAAVLRAIARKVPLIDEDAAHRIVHDLAARLRELAADRPMLYRAVAWATANWLLDAASLWVFVTAFGHRVGPDALLVSYGLAFVLAAIPLTPGGLGVVEGVLTSLLVGFGTPRGIAILGVVSYRLANFWLPIPAGGAAYLSLRLDRGATRTRRAEELERLANESRLRAEGAGEWAHRHGIELKSRGTNPPTV